ncbi:thioredoxin family protein [Knoellia sp. CPCC 206453]|uniref:thioredoxin family protein n=1 Tax=Knoellia pratensis TaxID=3404796 RepID=UPI003608AC07
MTLTTTTDATFREDVLASSLPVLVDFTANWCPPCRAIAPVLDLIATDEVGRMKVVSLDVDENPKTALAYGVLSMPTLALFVDGVVVSQRVGARSRPQIMRELEPHLGAQIASR